VRPFGLTCGGFGCGRLGWWPFWTYSSKVYSILWGPGWSDPQLSVRLSSVRRRRSTICVDGDYNWLINYRPPTAVCSWHSYMVLEVDEHHVCMSAVETAPDESTENRIHMVWITCYLQKITTMTSKSTLWVINDNIEHVNVVRDLGVTLDSELSMQNHVNTVARMCFYHIRHLKQVRRLLGPDVTAKLVAAIIFNRLDYCNAVLANLPKSTIAPLKRVQNAVARRLIVTSIPKDLHWLPVEHRIVFTARCYASTVYAVVLCPTICLSVTNRHCTKMVKRTQTTPYNRPATQVFWCQRSRRNSDGVSPTETPNRGRFLKNIWLYLNKKLSNRRGPRKALR